MSNNPINLFQASESEIKLLKPKLAFYLSSDENGLRVRFFRKNIAFRYIKTVPAIHYTKRDKSYYFPTELLTDFIKSLKRKKTSFAVHESAGKRLIISAETRRKIIETEIEPSNQDLEFSLLYPCIIKKDHLFTLKGATEKHLQILKPRNKEKLSLNELPEIIYNSYFEDIKIWLSKEVRELLVEKTVNIIFEQSFNDSTLGIFFPTISLCCDQKGRPMLQVREDLKLKLSYQTWIQVINPITQQSSKFYYLPLTKLSETTESINKLVELDIPYSNSFKNSLNTSKGKEQVLARSRFYNSIEDINLCHANSEIIAKLFPHQRVAVSWILENEYGLLGDDMGLGKTLSILASYDHLRKTEVCDFILVICPNSLVKNWQRESQLWFNDMKLLAMPKSKTLREDFFRKFKLAPTDWIAGLVINFESSRIETTITSLLEILANRKVLFIVDEAQRAKNPQSKTFAALKKLSLLSKKRFLLSGTPTPRDFSDIWSQVYLLDQGARFGKSFYTWLATIAELGNKWSPFAVKKYKKAELEEAALCVQELLLRRKKEDVVSLPEKLFSVRDVELVGDQKKRFQEVCKDLIVRIGKLSGDQYLKHLDSVLEQMLRAVQIGSNPRLVDESWQGEPVKFIELDNIVEEVVGENEKKLVIWTNYLKNVRELQERYAQYGALTFSGEVSEKDRDLNIQHFQNDNKFKILIAVPAAGGVGITLTAAQTAVYLEKTWNAEHWMQSIDRLHRIGQKGTVNIISLHSCFIDEVIYKNVRKKQHQQSLMMGDYTKAELPSKEQLLEYLKHT